MYFKRLTEENYQIYAMQHYDNQECNSVEDFYEDINRIKYVKRLFRRYVKKDELRERLIINHIVSLSNVFGVEPATRLLFFKIENELWPILKTFLVLLSYMPERLKDPEVISSDIPLDERIVNTLRKI
jgi:hypothetical protein|tara:strand:+ start:1202 stop:1585 length:384 start_codon:yes stop_codon:yes gene_type:complete